MIGARPARPGAELLLDPLGPAGDRHRRDREARGGQLGEPLREGAARVKPVGRAQAVEDGAAERVEPGQGRGAPLLEEVGARASGPGPHQDPLDLRRGRGGELEAQPPARRDPGGAPPPVRASSAARGRRRRARRGGSARIRVEGRRWLIAAPLRRASIGPFPTTGHHRHERKVVLKFQQSISRSFQTQIDEMDARDPRALVERTRPAFVLEFQGTAGASSASARRDPRRISRAPSSWEGRSVKAVEGPLDQRLLRALVSLPPGAVHRRLHRRRAVGGPASPRGGVSTGSPDALLRVERRGERLAPLAPPRASARWRPPPPARASARGGEGARPSPWGGARLLLFQEHRLDLHHARPPPGRARGAHRRPSRARKERPSRPFSQPRARSCARDPSSSAPGSGGAGSVLRRRGRAPGSSGPAGGRSWPPSGSPPAAGRPTPRAPSGRRSGAS